MNLAWLAILGVFLLVAGLCTLAYDTVRRKKGSNPYPYPDYATTSLDETAIQPTPKPKPVPSPPQAASTPAPRRTTARLLSKRLALPGVLKRVPPDQSNSSNAPSQAAQPRSDLLTRILLAIPRRAFVLIVLGSFVLIAMSLAILTAGANTPQQPPGTVIVGISPFVGQSTGGQSSSLADYIIRSATAGGLPNLVVRSSRISPANAEAAEAERARLGADFLIWGDYGPQGAITVELTLSPQFGPEQAVWQAFSDPDMGALVLPQRSVIFLPPGKGIDPIVPLTLGLAHLKLGDYADAADAAWGAQATIDDAGGTGQFARLVEAIARVGASDNTNCIAAVDLIEKAGAPPPEALLARAESRLYLQDYTAATDDSSRVIGERAASDLALSRAYLLRARARYTVGDLTDALADLDESARLDPHNLRVKLDRAEVLYRQAKPTEAASQLDALIKGAPNAAPAYRLMGLVRLMLGQPEEALKPLGSAANLYGNSISGLRTEEAQAEATGDSGSARRATDGIVSLNRALAGVNLYEGMAYADIARKEPKESFLGGIWRGIRGEPATWERGIAKMQEAQKLDPRRPDIPLQIGALYTQQGDYAKAAEALQQARSLDPSGPEPYMALARLQESQGQPKEAIATLDDLLSHSPRYYPAYETMYRLYTGMADAASAQSTLQRAVAIQPQTTYDHLWRGKFLQTLNRKDEAEADLRTAATDPALWEAHLHLGQILADEGRNPDALAEFQAVLSTEPDNEVALLSAGRLLVLAGQPDDAQKLFERLEGVAPANVDCHIALLQLLLSKGDVARAIAEGRRAVVAGDTRADAHFFLGLAFETKGDWPAASAEYRAATERDQNDFQAFLSLARSLFHEDRYADSIDVSNKTIALRADDPQPYRWKAEAQFALGDVDGALSSLGSALRLRPADADALALTSRAYGAKGDELSAIEYAKQATQANPQNPAGQLALGEIELAKGRPQEALQAFGTALEVADAGMWAQAMTGQGRAYDVLGDKNKALQSFAAAAAKYPNAAEPHLYAGNLYVEQSRWDDSLSEYRRAVQLRPNWPLALYYLGKAYLQRKDLPNAQSAFAKAVQYSPGMIEAWFGLGIAHRDQGHHNEAIDALTRATGLNANYAEAWLYLGLTYEETGNRQSAADAFTHARDTASDPSVKQQADEGLARVR